MRRFAWIIPFLAAILPAAAAAPAPTAVILDCHDGDTCRLDREILPGRDRVRIANIDTPELGDRAKCRAERMLAELARQAAAAHAGERVTLTAISPDKYAKRFDALVRLPDGRDLGQAQLDAGLALPWTGRRVDWCLPSP